MGLAGEQTSKDTLDRLLPTIRNDIAFESDMIGDAGFEHLDRIREIGELVENGEALASFLSVTSDKGYEIANQDHLFAD